MSSLSIPATTVLKPVHPAAGPSIDGMFIVNTVYHGAVITGLAIGIAKLTKGLFKENVPKLGLDDYDAVMSVIDISTASALRDVLLRWGLPNDIMK